MSGELSNFLSGFGTRCFKLQLDLFSCRISVITERQQLQHPVSGYYSSGIASVRNGSEQLR